MKLWKLALAALVLAGPAAAETLKPGEMARWSDIVARTTYAVPTTYTSGEVTVVLSTAGRDENLIALEIHAGAGPLTRFVIDDVGKAVDTMEPDALIGFFDLDPEAEPGQVVVVDYVCMQACTHVVRLVERRDGAWRMIRIGESDRGGDFELPSDLDGDGVLDVSLPDSRFVNMFPIPSALSDPPRLLNVRGGRVTDVSAKPGFRPVFAKVAEEARPVCEGGDETGCEIFAASSARAGTVEAAWRTLSAAPTPALASWPVCRREPRVVCRPRDEVRVASFAEALRWKLGQIEYLPPGPPLRPVH